MSNIISFKARKQTMIESPVYKDSGEYTKRYYLRNSVIGNHKTTVFEDNGYINVVYHATCVVKFNDKEIILNTGGWESRTTKVRMNQTANQYLLGYSVFQNKGVWYVSYRGNTYTFTDNIVVLDR